MSTIINAVAPSERDRIAHVPAGTYYLGDPCYTVPSAEWMEYLSPKGQAFGDVEGRTIQLDSGRVVAAHSTAHGDGVFTDEGGFSYGVDAGLIGVVSAEDGDDLTDAQAAVDRKLVRVVTFDRPFTVTYHDGLIAVTDPTRPGRGVRIDTDPDTWE